MNNQLIHARRPTNPIRFTLATLLFASLASLPALSHAETKAAGSKASPNVQLPAATVVVGKEADGRQLYLCLVTKDGTHVGKTWNDNPSCAYANGTNEESTDQFEVPSAVARIDWIAGQSAKNKKLVVVGSSASGSSLYLCRAPHEGGVHPGEMESVESGCKITYGGDAFVAKYEFEVATSKAAQPLSSPALKRLREASAR